MSIQIDPCLFDYVVNEFWLTLNQLKLNLNLSPQTPIEVLIRMFKQFREIQATFSLKNSDYSQLNELLIEITAIRNILQLYNTSLHEVLLQIKPEHLSMLGHNSLLEKMMLYSWSK